MSRAQQIEQFRCAGGMPHRFSDVCWRTWTFGEIVIPDHSKPTIGPEMPFNSLHSNRCPEVYPSWLQPECRLVTPICMVIRTLWQLLGRNALAALRLPPLGVFRDIGSSR